MGFLKGLDAYQKHQEQQLERDLERANRVKTEWFKLGAGESVKIRFLQELDPSASGYDEEKGIGFIVSEHTNPDDFKKRAVCTTEDGECEGCAQNQLSYRQNDEEKRGKWKARQKLYINVLVDNGKDEPHVVVLSQGTSAKTIVPALYSFAVEDDTITSQWFKITRTGGGFNDTSYSMIPTKVGKDLDFSSFEIFDLDKVIRNIPFEKQADFYDVKSATESSSSQDSSDDDGW